MLFAGLKKRIGTHLKTEHISRFKKERYLLSLSEDDFRDKVIRPLFLRSGYSDGRDLCGPSEHGKDAIFAETSKLGLNSFTAVQTKKGNLNLASKASSNLVNAIVQLKTALDSTLVIAASKQKVKPNIVILCSSGKINDAARQHIADEVRNPNIQFLDVNDLIPRIDDLFPEIWLGIEADILPYYQALERFVLGEPLSGVKSSEQDGVLIGAADDRAFVTMNLYRTTVKTKKVHGKIIETPTFEEFPLTSIINKKMRRILLLGDAGSGKSTGLMRIALESARRGLETDKHYTVPILLKATDISRQRPSSFVEYCDTTTRQLSNSSKSCFTADDLEGGRVHILIDGLDEVGNDSDRLFVIDLLVEFSNSYPKCQVMVTSRPYRFINETPNLKSFEEFRVSPISWRQAEKIVSTITEHKKVPREQSQEFLRRLETIHGIELNPLLVTVFAATTDYTKQDIPANITELFKKFTELMLGRWDERKGFKLQHQANVKDFVLTKIAFHMHKSRQTSLSVHEAEQIARSELLTRGHEADVDALLKEIFERSSLFRVVGEQIEFRHQLLQEFFAGRGIESPEFINTILVDDWWKRALVFYFGDHPDSISLLKSATIAVNGEEPDKLVEAATTVGLALQACYLSPVTEKIEIWKWVAQALGLSQEAYLQKIDLENKYPITRFFHYYLFSRDSVALSHLKQNSKELYKWGKSAEGITIEEEKQKSLFWLAVGLIESGDITEAEEIIKGLSEDSGIYLTAISLGCHLAHEVRPLNADEKEKAGQICKKIEKKVAPYRQQLINEFGSHLLEMRNGEVTAIDE